jgi:urea transport system substrate-binding protein
MSGRAFCVLAIDDDEDLVDLLRFILEGNGYRVVTAANGQEGLAAVAASMPDLILLDMKMPVMDGWTFAKEFHRLYEKGAPIVVVTAAEDPRQRALEAGAVGWVSKPFESEDLLRAIATVAAPASAGCRSVR